jgi:hypothetical protein
MKNAVELCQREGRGRHAKSRFVIMEQRSDRPLSNLRKVQHVQENVIHTFDPSGNSNPRDEEKKRIAQRSREVQARKLLFDPDSSNKSCAMILSEYRQKTKGDLDSVNRKNGERFIVTTTYSSITTTVEAHGEGLSKQAARQESARALLSALEDECS